MLLLIYVNDAVPATTGEVVFNYPFKNISPLTDSWYPDYGESYPIPTSLELLIDNAVIGTSVKSGNDNGVAY